MLNAFKDRLRGWVNSYHSWTLEERVSAAEAPARDRLKSLCLHLHTLPPLPPTSAVELPLQSATIGALQQAWVLVARGMAGGDYPYLFHYLSPAPEQRNTEDWAVSYLISESVRGIDRKVAWNQAWRVINMTASEIEMAIHRDPELAITYRGPLNTLLIDTIVVLKAARKGWEV